MPHAFPSEPGQPRHGGALAGAARHYGIAPDQWLDLSTGINPVPYPVPPLGPAAFARLPDPDDLARLNEIARAAYGVPPGAGLVAVPGTDIALRLLPKLFASSPVAIVSPTYSGHAEAWTAAGHETFPADDLAGAAARAPIVVLANPNNPDGRVHTAADILAVAESGRTLIVDEAFCDLTPERSVIPQLAGAVIVLRSFGKFYGLAGLRLGFAIGPDDRIGELARLMGDWPISGPALAIGSAALSDAGWQAATRLRLAEARTALDALLVRHGFADIAGTDLFRTVRTPGAGWLHAELARRAIWTRIFAENPQMIRFGLPHPDGFDRLAAALAEIAALT